MFAIPASAARHSLQEAHLLERGRQGGHYAAWEQPELLAEEIRAAFRPLRE